MGFKFAKGFRMRILVVSLIVFALNFTFVSTSFGEKEKFSVSIALNTNLKQTNQSSQAIQKLTKKHEDGLKTIKGPINLNLILSEAGSFDVDNANLIILRNKNSKVKYVQIFPLSQNLDRAGMQSVVKEYEQKLIAINWQKQILPVKKSVLESVGVKDLAHYKMILDVPFNGVNEYEMVFTRFIDANVNCSASADMGSECKNCFLRISLTSVTG